MPLSSIRALHYVLKVHDRTATVAFLRDVLGMHALRHEEFEEGCKAACNGPFDGKWSKTMFGYGPEDQNFVLELTYNYGVKHYQHGNTLGYIKIRSQAAFKTVLDKGLGYELDLNVLEVKDPDGHTYRVINEEPSDCGPIASLCLYVSSLEKAAEFWCDALGFLEVDKGDSPAPFITLSTGGADQATLRLTQLPAGGRISQGTGYGRVAFSCPGEQLGDLQEEVAGKGYTVLTPLLRLDTPGKASVEVVILADPDGHEVCFVGDEAFRELSQLDESAPQLLGQAIAKDGSKAWFEERSKRRKTGDASGAAAPAAAAPASAAAAAAAAAPAPASAGAISPTNAGTYAAAAAKAAGAPQQPAVVAAAAAPAVAAAPAGGGSPGKAKGNGKLCTSS